MSAHFHNQILSPDDGPVAEIVNATGKAPVLIVCEHASPAIPPSLNELGLAKEDRLSHAVWDPGAETLTRSLSERIDAPAIVSRVSRLVYDCNRPPERPDAMPAQTETIRISGNANLSQSDRDARTQEIYLPFHRLVSDALDAFTHTPALVTIHSFTPKWFDTARPTELGLLHDADPTLALAMMKAAEPGVHTELNRPYSAADGVTHTLDLHGTKRGLRNVMIEVRNDLLTSDDAVTRMSALLARMLRTALDDEAHAA